GQGARPHRRGGGAAARGHAVAGQGAACPHRGGHARGGRMKVCAGRALQCQ
ncbi:hypothetical protein CFC21_095155, partial [Triticum aestivum]